MKNVSEPGVYGVSRYGRSKYGKKSSCPQFAELSEILFLNIKDKKKLSKNQINDVMHLMAHANARNDIFLTSDKKDFIAKGRREK
ncbi:hypothetical protein NITGR_270028 [Nitrospina gracilis 3/211]|uniref:PIN domain-containing protein n=2 Tax=Nitrospina TaxID=35800 RepID=M1YX69_NITG3|nr:hypothetical protein [Nitrospina gracilis]CCQ90268.1 hypothetical protein NITGR_270028 [Nitrospina gracilis 3/211]